LGSVYIGFISTKASSTENGFISIQSKKCIEDPTLKECKKYGMLYIAYPEYLVTGLFLILIGSTLQIKSKK